MAESMTAAVPNPGQYALATTLTATASDTAPRLNHSMLRIASPTRSLAFYTQLFGMSQTFSFNTGPFTIYYLAYPSVGDAVPADIHATSGLRSGLLELIHVHGPENEHIASGNEPSAFGFGHLGFTVPDVGTLLEKAKEMGFEVLKEPGDVAARALGLPDTVADGALHPKFLAMYAQCGFLQDPDG